MTRARTPGEHHSSHSGLLRPARTGHLPLDTIVVPAAREAGNLRSVLRLGADLAVPVVVLCSRHARPADVLAVAEQVRGARCTAVDLAGPVDVGLPDLETADFGEAMIGSHGDLSLKRNLGLVLGRRCGWRTVLFLDDDIRGVVPTLVRRAVGALTHHVAVGMPATGFPDNSVVCHARRVAGQEQDVFVSGSALAVNLDRVGSFFPEVYNEDWLFLAPHLEAREVARIGAVRQRPYDPFRDPMRANGEEFGDVLAEGLLGALHLGSTDATRLPAYWAEFLDRRAEFIASAAYGCRQSEHPSAVKAMHALVVAERSRARLSPAVLADYVAAWRDDMDRWKAYISGLAPRDDLPAALLDLGLRSSMAGPVPASDVPSRRSAE